MASSSKCNKYEISDCESGCGSTVTVPDSEIELTKRLPGVNVVKPIIIGNVSKNFEGKREDEHTHEWTVYVKPYLNEDYSAFIKKVHFKLHHSYANSNRVVTDPPYQITETGWGEFNVMIKIYFNDAIEKPVTTYHWLKLYPLGADANTSVKPNTIVKSEFFDELVFQDPSVLMKSLLDNVQPLTDKAYVHETNFEARKKYSTEVLTTALRLLKSEIQKSKEKLKLVQEVRTKFLNIHIEKCSNGNSTTEMAVKPDEPATC